MADKMEAPPAAPQQYKQPSRKGKKAWRKNVDVSEVQEGLEVVRDEVIHGGVLAEKPSEELFTVDTTGSQDVKPAKNKKEYKPLKSEMILGQRSAIPAIDSRKRSSSKVTDGIIHPKTKRQRSDWVTNKELRRLKGVAQAGNPVNNEGSQTENTLYDPWAEPQDESVKEDLANLDFLEKKKPVVPPPTLKEPPISLAANGKPVPSVKNPGGEASYNPVFHEWDRVLVEEGQKAVEEEKARMEEEKKEQERIARIEAAQDDGAMKSDDESAWEGFESEHETPEWLNKKRPERKTQAQRNKIKRRKEAERKARWEAQMKKRQNQVEQIRSITKAMKMQNEEQKQSTEGDSSDEGDDTNLRRRPFGKLHAPKKPLELVLPDELQDSLRLLKPEGNLLDDRFRNMVVRGKVEPRKPIAQPKKKKVSFTEKWTYKDFEI